MQELRDKGQAHIFLQAASWHDHAAQPITARPAESAAARPASFAEPTMLAFRFGTRLAL